jgi:PAS domain S-box-containing protein
MNHPIPISQLTLFVAAAIVVGGLFIVMVFLVHKAFKDQRKSEGFVPKSPRVEDESGFAMAAMQGVIAKMKEQEKELVELRQVAERRARESARLSENVLREMPSGLLVFSRDGFLTTANPAVRKLLGVDTWARRRYPEILGPDSSLARHVQECLETARVVAQESVEYETPAGRKLALGVSLSPLRDPNGEVEGAICLLTDLTEMQKLQETVRLKEHLAALGAMSAGIAHELKNSLATISGYAQLVRDSGLPEEDAEYARKLVAEIRALTQVVGDFLNLSKPIALDAHPVNVEEQIHQAVEDLQQIEAFRKVTFGVTGEFPVVEGDEVLLRQAFSNLLRNACEAVADPAHPGSVTIHGEIIPGDNGDSLSISMSDTGPGVPAENHAKLFLPFFTTKSQGSGLGLALVQKIVVSHNGTVALETSAPESARFVVQLPLSQAARVTGKS